MARKVTLGELREKWPERTVQAVLKFMEKYQIEEFPGPSWDEMVVDWALSATPTPSEPRPFKDDGFNVRWYYSVGQRPDTPPPGWWSTLSPEEYAAKKTVEIPYKAICRCNEGESDVVTNQQGSGSPVLVRSSSEAQTWPQL